MKRRRLNTAMTRMDAIPLNCAVVLFFIFAPHTSLIGQSLYYVNVRDFGARGDNSSNDTVAIQKAIDSQTSGGTIALPCGTYRVDLDNLAIRVKGIILQGASRDCVTIITRSSGAGVLLNLTSVGAGDAKIRDVMISGGGRPGVTCVAIGTFGNPKTSHVTITESKVTQCDPALKVYDSWDLGVENSLIEFNRGDGIDLMAPHAITGLYIHNSRIGNNGGFGVKNFGPGIATQLAISQSEVSYNQNTEIVFGPSRDWSIRDSWFEEFAEPKIAMDVTGCWRCTIDSNHFDHAIIGVFAASKIDSLTVSNNSFTNTVEAAVKLDGGPGEGVVVTGNRSNTPIIVGKTVPAVGAANQIFKNQQSGQTPK